MLITNHPNKARFVIFDLLPDLVLFRANFTTEKKPSVEMDRFLNTVNRSNTISRVFYDLDGELVVLRFESVYTGQYSRETFSQFWDALQDDLKRLWTLDAAAKVFST